MIPIRDLFEAHLTVKDLQRSMRPRSGRVESLEIGSTDLIAPRRNS